MHIIYSKIRYILYLSTANTGSSSQTFGCPAGQPGLSRSHLVLSFPHLSLMRMPGSSLGTYHSPASAECWEENRCLPGLCTGRSHFFKAPLEGFSQLWMSLKYCPAAREWLVATVDTALDTTQRRYRQGAGCCQALKGSLLSYPPLWSLEEGDGSFLFPPQHDQQEKPWDGSGQGQVHFLCLANLLYWALADPSPRENPLLALSTLLKGDQHPASGPHCLPMCMAADLTSLAFPWSLPGTPKV